jgi:hypothetical protein
MAVVVVVMDVLRLADAGRGGGNAVVVEFLVVLGPLLFISAFPFEVEIEYGGECT